MYQVGDRVLYASHGVCTVVGIEKMKFGKTAERYYCLQPLERGESMYYVPAEKPAAVGKLRPLLTKDELLELLRSDALRQGGWIKDDNQRKLLYRSLIGSTDRAAILAMLRNILLHKQCQETQGKRLHQCDENFLQDAQRMLASEFSVVLELDAATAAKFIREELTRT